MTNVAYGIAFPASRGVLGHPAAPLLLDRLAAAPTLAFATWRLRNGYAGACLRVRRSSDNAEQDVGFSGVGLDTTALLNWCGAGDGFVTKWYDQSGNGRVELQSTTANQPKIVAAGALIADINGLPSIKSTGSSIHLTSQPNFDLSNLFNGATHTAVSLARPAAAGVNDSDGYANPAAIGSYNGLFYHSYGLTKFMACWSTSAPAGQVAIAVAGGFPSNNVAVSQSDGTTMKAWLNGGAATSNTQGAVTSLTGVWSRSLWANNAASYFVGDLAAKLTFNSALSLSDINAIGADWAARAGISWTTAS